MSDEVESHGVEEHFSLPLFLFTIAVSLVGLAGLLWLVAPASVWQAQVATTLGRFAVVFLAISMFNCFVEYVFHRYVLHKPVVGFLSRFYRQHTLHHSLTRIGRRRTPGGREVPFVENVYPVTEPEQGEASFFPWYTLAVFAGVTTPLLALGHWVAPSLPWFFGGYAAIAFSLTLYEVFHAIEHWAFERWAPLIEHPRMGWFWRKVYSFHLRHHAVIDCNEAISGFFTLPVFDWVFGTFILPKSLYVDGSEWKQEEFVSPRPYAFIRWLDRKSDELVVKRREQERAPVQPAAAFTAGERAVTYLTSGTGLAASVAALVMLVVLAVLRGEARHVVGAAIFGVALVSLYAAFLDFRDPHAQPLKKRLHKYNHAAIFLAIAGTATPFLLGSMRGPWAWSLFGTVWGLSLVGASCRLIGGELPRTISRYAYALLALAGLIALKPLAAAIPPAAVWLLVGGAVCYGVGTAFHLWHRLRYHQIMRHAFALGGTACHLLAVLLFVLPRG
jgi:hemolysin III